MVRDSELQVDTEITAGRAAAAGPPPLPGRDAAMIARQLRLSDSQVPSLEILRPGSGAGPEHREAAAAAEGEISMTRPGPARRNSRLRRPGRRRLAPRSDIMIIMIKFLALFA